METIKVRWSVATQYRGSAVRDILDTGLSPEEWESLDEAERDALVLQTVMEHVSWEYEVVEEQS